MWSESGESVDDAQSLGLTREPDEYRFYKSEPIPKRREGITAGFVAAGTGKARSLP